MYAPHIQVFCYILRFSVTFIAVKWMPVDKLTQNLGFNIPFNLYIHDLDREQPVGRFTCVLGVYVPSTWVNTRLM